MVVLTLECFVCEKLLLLTLLLGVVEVLREGETVGDLQRPPNHQPHQEPRHQLRTATFLLTVFDNLERNLAPSQWKGESERRRDKWREVGMEVGMEVVLGSKHLGPLPLHTCYSNAVGNFCHGSTFGFFHEGPSSLVISFPSATRMGFCGRIYHQFCILNDIVTN